MGAYYDEIEIEDMAWDEAKGVFHYPCPCGDRFEISRAQLASYEDIATCPSCSLVIRVVYDPLDFEDDADDDGASDAESESESESESDSSSNLNDEKHEKSGSGDDALEGALEKLRISGPGPEEKQETDATKAPPPLVGAVGA